MLIKALKAKIHRATVTQAQADYPGSIGVDTNLLEAAGIAPYEEVLVADITNGARLETYVIPAPAGSGEISILGAAARQIKTGDLIIIMNFAYLTPEEMKSHKPKVVIPDEKNQPKKIL